MPNLQFELEQLDQADRHIAVAEKNLQLMTQQLEQSRNLGDDTSIAQRALSATQDGLEAFRQHRALIVQTIEDIRAGRLPST